MSIPSAKLARKSWLFGGLLLVSFWFVGIPAIVAAFQEADDASKADQEVVIKREVLKLTDPRSYKISLHLSPTRSVDLTAPTDGYVRNVAAKAGQRLKAQSEAVRLDDARAVLVQKKARANHAAAQAEKKIAQAKNDADQTALAEAHFEAAQADVELAQFDADQLVVRVPFNCEVQKMDVVDGQFVKAGEKLGTVIDSTRLSVEVPVERSAAAVGSNIEIKVEETLVKARVDSVTALAAGFDSLRELTVSPASAVVSLDNTAAKFFAGQTVYSDLVPLSPVAMVPAGCVSNVTDGSRKVQILRDNVVRDLVVRILAKVGTDSVFVSGRFNDGDEVIVTSSRPLTDGTPLRALAAGSNPVAGGGAGKPAAGAKAPAKKPATTGF